ncbi:MAG TPA: DNA-3-methyladenine glycosylase [Candidatus Solibacter sp.]|nr:DNA-3-methyladenine glycosylase [Candidatus Solibacter sp.]
MSHRAAVRHLKRADPVMRRIIIRVGPCLLHERVQTNPLRALVGAIIAQQISWHAARTVEARFFAIYGCDSTDRHARFPEPERILATPVRKLRAAGLSRQKVSYIRDIAARAASGELPLAHLGRMKDDVIMERLTAVKGIGRWTAEVFMLFSLGRPDVLPVDDLGIQHAIRLAYKLRRIPSEKKMLELAEVWRPYRSVASWYLWRSRRDQTTPKK